MTGVLKVQTAPGVWEATNGGVTHEYMDNAHWNTAWGIIGKSNLKATTISLSSTPTAVLTSPLAVTLVTGRRYAVSFSVRAADVSTAPGTFLASLVLDGSAVGSGDHYLTTLAAGTYGGGYAVRWLLDGDGGAHLLTVNAYTLGAVTGTLHCQVGPASFVAVEDIGPITRLPEGVPPALPDWTAYDARYLNTDGDVAAGPLLLPATQSGEPTAATNKAYVDQLANHVIPLSRTWASVAGAGSVTLGPPSNGWIHWMGVTCPACSIDGLGFEVTTAGGVGSVTRIGIYNSNPARIEPYQLFHDAGTVATATTGFKSISFTAKSWPGGWMWLGLVAQAAVSPTPVYRATYGHGEPWILFGIDQVPPALSYRSWTMAVGDGALPATATPGLAAVADPKISFHVP